MAETGVILTRPAGRLLTEMADRHRQQLPPVGRRTRRNRDDVGGNLKSAYIVQDITGATGGAPDWFAVDYTAPTIIICNSLPDATGKEYLTVHIRSEIGAFFTGQRVKIARIKDDFTSDTQWEIVQAGGVQWSAVAAGDLPGGNVTIEYYDFRTSVLASIDVPAELFNASSPIASGGDCWVMFDASMNAGAGGFVAIPRDCPDYQAEV